MNNKDIFKLMKQFEGISDQLKHDIREYDRVEENFDLERSIKAILDSDIKHENKIIFIRELVGK